MTSKSFRTRAHSHALTDNRLQHLPTSIPTKCRKSSVSTFTTPFLLDLSQLCCKTLYITLPHHHTTNKTSTMSRLLLLRRALRPSTTLLPTTTLRPSSSFTQSPAPPRLPAEQQAEFERLRKEAEEALYTHTQTPSSETKPTLHPEAVPEGQATFSGGIRKGAPPEFEGDKNPNTGEVGGPKNEPLRWGDKGDWSYNGRVTDF